jgi:hypothetical protein
MVVGKLHSTHIMMQDVVWKPDGDSACQEKTCFLSGARRFVAVFPGARHWHLSLAGRIRFAPSIPMLMLSPHLCLGILCTPINKHKWKERFVLFIASQKLEMMGVGCKFGWIAAWRTYECPVTRYPSSEMKDIPEHKNTSVKVTSLH